MNSDGGRTVSPRARTASASRSAPGDGMPFQRQVVFWLAALAVFVLLLWLLSEILLPFVAGLAHRLSARRRSTDRLERLGVNRLAAALLDHHRGGAGDRRC